MQTPVFRIFDPGLKFHYEYDYGSTTDLDLNILWEREGPRHKPSIQILSRNEPPVFQCTKCGKAGKFICQECSGDGETYCLKCLKKHPCGEDMVLPVVNSPRMGVCGYTGPWEENGGNDNDSDECNECKGVLDSAEEETK